LQRINDCISGKEKINQSYVVEPIGGPAEVCEEVMAEIICQWKGRKKICARDKKDCGCE